VGYREFTRRAALRLGVSGWVRNRSDGTFEALVWGLAGARRSAIVEMRKGPRSAVVDNLGIIERDRAHVDDTGMFIIGATA
jgi:acylphosphatase